MGRAKEFKRTRNPVKLRTRGYLRRAPARRDFAYGDALFEQLRVLGIGLQHIGVDRFRLIEPAELLEGGGQVPPYERVARAQLQ